MIKWPAVTLVLGTIAFLLTPLMPRTGPQPPDNLLPLFIVLILFESLAFGLGIAFLVFGYPMLRRMGGPRGLTVAAYLAVAFLLANWWPHDALHRATSYDWTRLVLIEYGFHLPLIAAGAVLAWFFMSIDGRGRAIAK